jgi:hypothetical protein
MRVGNSAGCEGPQIYLAKGKAIPHKILMNLEKIGHQKV